MLWRARLGRSCRGCSSSSSASRQVGDGTPPKLAEKLLVVDQTHHWRKFLSFRFSVESRTLWDFDEILIVGSAVNFILRGQQFLGCSLHEISSGQAGAGDRTDASRVDGCDFSGQAGIARIAMSGCRATGLARLDELSLRRTRGPVQVAMDFYRIRFDEIICNGFLLGRARWFPTFRQKKRKDGPLKILAWQAH
jgi:hypothetical protein